ncbi:molybdate ABC transporter substrate-binding protein [Bacillus sp. KH172YL63]|uniref:molybdate ABC transporter substrate-binding protein n=1 Tax=Bacillus sp. KH172YL63 TaxID=2709784 RepID=UPI0013E43365|nr:molybdate ABC transporter substrate-binding protein [Bacillus sp. KH172YL63]BCB02486.1 putative ABC transporter substrate-binding lipoprotein YvgL [Bacillus sp. KH172YL63]
MKRISISLILFSILFIFGCSPFTKDTDAPVNITVSAASSMTESLNELKDRFEKEHPDISVTYNFGGTGTLRKQVEQGAPVDLFFLASQKDYVLLEEKGFIQKGFPIFENRLVLIKHKEVAIDSFDSFLSSDEKVAIGTPDAVPAGTYSKQMLQAVGAWDMLSGDNRLVFAKDVHHVLNLVETGAVDIGFVYASDTLHADNIDIVEEIDPELHEPITYYMAEIDGRGSSNEDEIETFYEYALSAKGLKLFKSYGFAAEKKSGGS